MSLKRSDLKKLMKESNNNNRFELTCLSLGIDHKIIRGLTLNYKHSFIFFKKEYTEKQLFDIFYMSTKMYMPFRARIFDYIFGLKTDGSNETLMRDILYKCMKSVNSLSEYKQIENLNISNNEFLKKVYDQAYNEVINQSLEDE